MEKHLAKIRTIIKENSILVDEMLSVAADTQAALIDRSSEELFDLSAKQQTMLARLQIVKITIDNLTTALRRAMGVAATHPRPNIIKLMTMLEANAEIALFEELKKKMDALKETYMRNELLLNKQYSSLAAYRQLRNLVSGTSMTYDKHGTAATLKSYNKIEHQG